MFSNVHANDLHSWVPWDSLKRENSALMAVLGKEGRRSRSSCRRETCDCLCVAGMCWVKEIRKRTRPTSSSLRVNTCNLYKFKPHCTSLSFTFPNTTHVFPVPVVGLYSVQSQAVYPLQQYTHYRELDYSTGTDVQHHNPSL